MALQRDARNYYADYDGNTPDDGKNLALGYYQYITLDDIVNNFMFSKTGEGRLLGVVNRNLISFHVQRAIQELNYDVLRVEKSLQVEINPSTRSIPIPQDFVSEVQISWLDSKGYKHPMLPGQTQAGQSPVQDNTYKYLYDSNGNLLQASPSDAVVSFKSDQPTSANAPGYDLSYFFGSVGNDYEIPSNGYPIRYGLNTTEANSNGRYVIDRLNGIVYFDDSIRSFDGGGGIFIAIDYISDGLEVTTEGIPKIQVNKFAEAAVYKMVEYDILSDMVGTQKYVLDRVKKEADTKLRNAKIRFMDLNLSTLAQWARGQAKWLKH